MMSVRAFEQRMAKIHRDWGAKRYDVALSDVEELLAALPGNAHLHTLWAGLVQLQDKPTHSLDAARKSLERAAVLDKDSPAGAIELGHFLDAVADDPQAASKAFSNGITAARRLLIDGLLGQAGALIQLGKREDALKCLMETLYLSNIEHPSATTNQGPAGAGGRFSMMMEDLLKEFFPKRSD